MSAVAIVGAGPYALSLAAHLAARNIPHRIFGRPMSFWSQIADAGGKRYLKSYCFGTNISAPKPGSTFADYSRPRGLETFEPCSIRDFASYGLWFQTENVPWLEPLEVEKITKSGDNFALALETGERVSATHLILATGLSHYAYTPSELATLPRPLAMHTAEIASFALFKGQEVAVVGGGQSALEAAALLLEAGARPQFWHAKIVSFGTHEYAGSAASGSACVRQSRASAQAPRRGCSPTCQAPCIGCRRVGVPSS